MAESESKIHKREEEFRRADNERMRRFFNARFDDIPAALHAGNSSEAFFGGAPLKKPSTSNTASANDSAARRNTHTASAARLPDPGEASRPPVRGPSDDASFLEGKVRKLEAELSRALEELRHKEQTLGRFREWRLADRYLSEDAVLKEEVERGHSRVREVHEQEAREMAEAAAQMVRTLQDLLDQKNAQLQAKEAQIDQMRKQMLQQSELDGLEIAKLKQQNSLAAGTTLAKLQEIVVKNDHGYNVGSAGGLYLQRYEKLTREELSRTLDEKDAVVQRQTTELAALDLQLRHLKEKNAELNDKVLDLSTQLDLERQQLELKAKVKELERVRREL